MSSTEREYPSPFEFHRCQHLTLVELRMRYFSGKVRNHRCWWEGIRDSELVSTWRKDMVNEDQAMVDKFWSGEERLKHGDGKKLWPRDPITDAQLDYIFDELKYDADRRDEATGIYVRI